VSSILRTRDFKFLQANLKAITC